MKFIKISADSSAWKGISDHPNATLATLRAALLVKNILIIVNVIADTFNATYM